MERFFSKISSKTGIGLFFMFDLIPTMNCKLKLPRVLQKVVEKYSRDY